MKWIIITPPDFVEGEATFINHLFESGLDLLHLRKPKASAADCKPLLDAIDPKWYRQIVVHDHFSLIEEYPLYGIHLNSRHHDIPLGFKGNVSCSCHSIEEVVRQKPSCGYVFLSPIFDSISKEGYGAHFCEDELILAAHKGIIDQQVYALGGVALSHLPYLKKIGFGGAAFLGDIWGRMHDDDVDKYLLQIKANIGKNL